MSEYSAEECESLTQALVKMGFGASEAAAIAALFVDRQARRATPDTAA